MVVAALLCTAVALVHRFSRLHVIKFHVSGRSHASIRRLVLGSRLGSGLWVVLGLGLGARVGASHVSIRRLVLGSRLGLGLWVVLGLGLG